jgi:hypothetical protein
VDIDYKKIEQKYVYLECMGFTLARTSDPIPAAYTPVARNPLFARTPCRVLYIVLDSMRTVGYIVYRPTKTVGFVEKWEVSMGRKQRFTVLRKYDHAMMVSCIDVVPTNKIKVGIEIEPDFDKKIGTAVNLNRRVIIYSDGDVWGNDGFIGITGSDYVRGELFGYLGEKRIPKFITLPISKQRKVEIEFNARGKKVESVIEPGTGAPSRSIPPALLVLSMFPESDK